MLRRSFAPPSVVSGLLLGSVVLACAIPPEERGRVPRPAWHEVVGGLPYYGPYFNYCDWLPPIPGASLKADPASLVLPVSWIPGPHSFVITNTSANPVEITGVRLSQCMFVPELIGTAWTAIAPGAPMLPTKPGQYVWLTNPGCLGVLAPGQSCEIGTHAAWHVFKAKIEILGSSGLLLEIPFAAHP